MNRRPTARTRRALAAGVVVPLLAAGLASCGGSDEATAGGKATAVDSSTASPDATDESPSAQPAGEEVDAQQFADDLATAYDGLTTAKVSLSFDGPATITSSGVVDYRGDEPALKMSVEGAYGTGTTSEVILVDKKMYLQIAGKNAKYLEVDLSDPDNPLASSMGDMSAIDPRATIEAFTQNVKSVSKIGPEDIDGTPTTHYVLVADTKALGDQLGKEAADLPDSLTYDMWLDEEGRPRRIQADLGDQGSMKTDMTDYGSEVSIEAPPADQVQAMPGS
jgi:hypothetical protein